MILVDNDPLVAAANRTDAHHAASAAALATAKPPRPAPGAAVIVSFGRVRSRWSVKRCSG